MKNTTRFLLGTLATTATMTGGAAGAHADDDGTSTVKPLVCSAISHGLVGAALNDLNSESVALSCGGALVHGPLAGPAAAPVAAPAR